MVKLIATRGYSSCGKTTFAEKWVKEDPEKRVNLNRDDLRASLFFGDGVLSPHQEQLITVTQQAAARAALELGKDVVLSDTNLRAKFLREWADLAADEGADFEVKDFHVPLDICLRRNRLRAQQGGRYVPSGAIENQAARFPYPWPEIKPRPNLRLAVAPYEDTDGLEYIILADIDGTIADMTRSGRNPFQWDRVDEDDPKLDIIQILKDLSEKYRVIFFSGRDGSCREKTVQWLEKHVTADPELYMRPAGDNRTDFIIKAELFDQHIRGKYNVRAVFDDRLQVARLWHQMGLPLLRVGDPDANF